MMGSTEEERQKLQPIHVGKDAAEHFLFAKGYRNLNHGSYGTYPIEVREVLRDYQDKAEAKPDDFIRNGYRAGLLDRSREAIASYLEVPTETCVLVPNASTGIESVLRNLVFHPGDVALCFADAYPAFTNALDYLSKTTPLQFHKVDYTSPVSDDYICDSFEAAIQRLQDERKTPKVALFDTISSFPAVRMPFERLTKICRDKGILSLIDGAHSVGQIPVRLHKLDPDFFVSNLHKWLYVPRGCAVMYVPKRNQESLPSSIPTGFHYGEGFVVNFSDTATLDNSPYLCVPAAIEWRKRLVWGEKEGEDAMEYIHHLAREGGRRVAKMLGTKVMDNEQSTASRCSMTNVKLPVDAAVLTVGKTAKHWELCKWMMSTVMIGEYQTAVLVYPYGGQLWARLSAQVYLTLEDFEYAGEKLKEVCERVEQGEWSRK